MLGVLGQPTKEEGGVARFGGMGEAPALRLQGHLGEIGAPAIASGSSAADDTLFEQRSTPIASTSAMTESKCPPPTRDAQVAAIVASAG